jgi:hypothetical protein
MSYKRNNSVLDTSSESLESSPRPYQSSKRKTEMALTKTDLENLRANINTDLGVNLNLALAPIVTQITQLSISVQRLERADRANNVIIHGVPPTAGKESSSDLVKVLESLWIKMGINTSLLIDNVYRLGKGSKAGPVLVKLVRNLDKQVVLAARKEAAKLKIYINEDLTPLQQSQKRQLNSHLRTLKIADPEIWGSIRENSLHVKKNGQVIQRFEIRDGSVKELTHHPF